MIQLNPTIPVIVTSKQNAEGLAYFVIDYSIDHHVIYGIALNESGEIWWVPNSEVRVAKNWTMGRR